MAAQSLDQNITNITALDGNTTVPVTEEDPVILRCNQTLKLETAIEVLNNTDQYKVINKVPESPKGGDTYLLIPHPGDEGKNLLNSFCS